MSRPPHREGKCKERVFSGARWDVAGHPCDYKAVTDAGFCRIHDPKLKAARDKARGPSPSERRWAERAERDRKRIRRDLVVYLRDQEAWSLETFGPGERTHGILTHIAQEMSEVAEHPDDVSEWIDIVILAFDGALRMGFNPELIGEALRLKLEKNMAREWPDWRQFTDGEAINHVRRNDDPTT